MVLRVLHLVGSAVSDFLCDLSRLYAEDCLASTADPTRYEFHVAYVTPDRRWRFPADLAAGSIGSARPMVCAEAVQHIAGLGIDVMVPQMFCVPGMTYYRGLFDVLEIPYLGNTPDVMALAAHKPRARAVAAAAGVRVPRGQLLRRGDAPTIGPPAVVKPVDSDNSVGVSLVRDAADYGPALEEAFAHSEAALAEEFVELGREVRCGAIVRKGELVCLPLEEYDVDPVRKPIRGYGDKLRRSTSGTGPGGRSDLHLVAKDSARAWILDTDDPVTERVWDAARACHEAFGCRHYSLFDFRVDPGGHPWFIEAGPYCSFARKSVVSVMAAAAGMPLAELFDTVLRESLGGGR